MVRSKSISAKELASVTALPGPKRYSHVISQCADWQVVWGLRTLDGWISAQGDEGRLAFVIWPHEPYAQQCAFGEWANAKPAALDLQLFLDTVVPGLVATRSQLAVFPTPVGAVVIVEVEQFTQDIQAELGRIE